MKCSQLLGFILAANRGTLCQCGASPGWRVGSVWSQSLPAGGGRDAGMCAGNRAGIQTEHFSLGTAVVGWGQQEHDKIVDELLRAPSTSGVVSHVGSVWWSSGFPGSFQPHCREGQFLQPPAGRGELRARGTRGKGASAVPHTDTACLPHGTAWMPLPGVM